jgi:hypothetical protein
MSAAGSTGDLASSAPGALPTSMAAAVAAANGGGIPFTVPRGPVDIWALLKAKSKEKKGV